MKEAGRWWNGSFTALKQKEKCQSRILQSVKRHFTNEDVSGREILREYIITRLELKKF